MKLWSPSVRHYSIGNLSIKLIAITFGFIAGFVVAHKTDVFDMILLRLRFAVLHVNADHIFPDSFIVEDFIEFENFLQYQL